MKLFAQLTKIDEAKRLVYGRAVQETPDRASEIFDYESSKPNFEKWSTAAKSATDGKSLGNVRAMHQPIAAGRLNDITFNDAEKAIDVVAYIVDDNEWKKCTEGVYTGFSIGGKYTAGSKKVEKINGKDITRYTAEPAEISLVDLPCIPTAQFSMVKADGSTELRKFHTASADEGASPAIAATTTDAEPSADDVSKSAAAERTDGSPPPSSDGGADAAADPDAAEKAAVSELVKLLDARTILPSVLLPLAKAEVVKAAERHVAERAAHLATEAARDDLTNADVEKLAAEFLTMEESAAVVGEGMTKMAGLYAALRAKADVAKRDFSDKQREAAADSGAALPDGSFPIKSKQDLKNAVRAYGRAKDKAAAKKHIIERAKALGATDELPDGWAEKLVAFGDLAGAMIEKGLWAVGQLADAVQCIDCLFRDAQFEADYEGDASPIPDRLKAVRDELAMILVEMADEETTEMADKAAVNDALEKAGARHSKADKDRLQAIHDHSVGMGAQCADAEKAAHATLCKAFGLADTATDDDIRKSYEEALRKAKLWDNAPAAPKGVVRITKSTDTDPTAVDDPNSSARENEINEAAKAMVSGDPLQLVKLMHRYGARPGLPPPMQK